MASTVTVRVSNSNFARGLRYVKQFGGKYDPNSRTWQIPADRPELGNLAAYHLELVTAPVMAAPYWNGRVRDLEALQQRTHDPYPENQTSTAAWWGRQ